jgi:photosystem II stability/assembly factor-like uncharacterized protein
VGWAVGRAKLFGTTNGGADWHQFGVPDRPLRSVHFVNRIVGWGVSAAPDPFGEVTRGEPFNGGSLVVSRDGGKTWTAVKSPADAQTVCFSDPTFGWLGAGGRVFRTRDAGQTWASVYEVAGDEGRDITAVVQCSAPDAALVLLVGGGAALCHKPYLAIQTHGGDEWQPVIKEPYTNFPQKVQAPSGPGSYPGPFSVVSASAAAFVGFTPPADPPRATTLVVATGDGRTLTPVREIPTMTEPIAAAFVSTEQGWIVGRAGRGAEESFVILATQDGGRSWDVQYDTPARP